MKTKKLFALLLVAVLIVTAFTGCASSTSALADPDAPVEISDETELTLLFDSDTTDWNYLVATSNTPGEYIDSLVEYDNYGLCQPCLAESWERSEDGLTWTFHIRQGVMWMTYDKQEYAETTAEDWVTSCAYILDPDNASRLADMMFTIKGAEEYYNAKLAGEDVSFDEMVGVKAIDKYTLQYTLEKPVPYFLSSTTYKNFFPANAQWIEECGDSFSTDNTTMLYNGEFIMTSYVPQSQIVSEINPTYWDMDNMYVTKITEVYNAEADTIAPEMFLRGEVSSADIPTEQLDEWLQDPVKESNIRPCRPSFYSYYYMFNFYPNFDEKYEPDNWWIAVNNVNFRKSIMYAMDKTAIVEVVDPYNTAAHIQNTITPSDFVSASGLDYTQLEEWSGWSDIETYNVDTATEYKEKAIEELTEAGATFPIKVFMPYNTGDNTQIQRTQVVEQMLERNLGTDYIDIITEGYADTDFSNQTMRAGNYCLQASTWMADYLDPLSYTDPFTIMQNRTNFIYRAEGASKVSDEYVKGSYEGIDGKYYYDIVYDQMVKEADQEVVDLDARYHAFAKIERWLVEDMCYVIPYMRGGTGYYAGRLSPFESQYAAFGASSSRYKYQHIYTKGIDTATYNEQYAEWQAERARRIEALAAEGKEFGVDY